MCAVRGCCRGRALGERGRRAGGHALGAALQQQAGIIVPQQARQQALREGAQVRQVELFRGDEQLHGVCARAVGGARVHEAQHAAQRVRAVAAHGDARKPRKVRINGQRGGVRGGRRVVRGNAHQQAQRRRRAGNYHAVRRDADAVVGYKNNVGRRRLLKEAA